MAPDRRQLLLALMATGLLPGCARAAPPPVAIPSILLRGGFLSPEGRIVDTGNGGISHSEGQGYGMLIAEAAGDRDSFTKLWEWTRRTLQRSEDGLFSWKFDPHAQPPVADPNNATDGDILIAWALARAAARWSSPDFAAASATIRTAIRQHLVRTANGHSVLLPALNGFENAGVTTLNPSYYVWPALDAFRRLDGAAAWGPVIADGEKLIAAARFGPEMLPTDWIDPDASGAPAPAKDRPPRFGFDAVRVPLYLAWSGRTALLGPFRTYWAKAMRAPFIPAWVDVVTNETANFPLSAGGMAIVDLTLAARTARPAPAQAPDYYASALLDLARIARAEMKKPHRL